MRSLVLSSAAVAAVLAIPPDARAGEAEQDCRVLEFAFTPADDLQIVVWLERADGTFVQTVFMTEKTGTYGLGNRPGRFDFNSAWAWPYGRRITTFPVWAHRHGEDWPLLEFQNGDDNNLSHPLSQSSREAYYCRPLRPSDTAWDTQTCASIIYTDKGVPSATERSLYPPRADLTYVPGTDHPGVEDFATMNTLDAVSRPTPAGGQKHSIVFAIPETLADGDYVAWIEVSKEFDQNEFYDYPSPIGIPWDDYGLAYRGQPSVVYSVPFTLGGTDLVSYTDAYAGYGDPDGLDGDVRVPDNTITTGVDGSGASRLLLTVDGEDMYRFMVATRPTDDTVDPGAPTDMVIAELGPDSVKVEFAAPGNDGLEGTVAGYEIKRMVATPMTDDNFESSEAKDAGVSLSPMPGGTVQDFTVDGLEPNTNYYIGVRAYDECLNYGPVSVVHFRTPRREPGTVSSCAVASGGAGAGPVVLALVALTARRRRSGRRPPSP